MAKKTEKNSADSKIKDLLSKSELPAALLLLGPDLIRRERVLQALLTRFSLDIKQKMEADALDNKALARLTESLGNLSLFSERQVLIVTDLEDLSSESEKKLAAIVERIPETNPTKIILSGKDIKRSSPIFKAFSSLGSLIELSELEGAELAKWTNAELKKHDVAANPELLTKLINICESKPDLIAQSIIHLSLYLDGEALSSSALESLFPGRFNNTEFQLIDAVLNRQYFIAENLLRRLLDAGSNQFGILSLLQRSYVNSLQIAVLSKAGVSDEASAKSLGIPFWLYNKQASNAKKIGSVKLRNGLDKILSADSRLKNRALGPELILSNLLQQLCT